MRGMTGSQVRTLWLRHNRNYGWSQQEFARRLGVNPSTFRKWLLKGVTGPSDILLRLLAAGKIAVTDIEKVNG